MTKPLLIRLLSSGDYVLLRVEQVFAAGGNICLATIVVLIVGDVIGRKIGHPLTFSVELSSYLQVVMMFLVGAYTLRLGLHIRADGLIRKLSPRTSWYFWLVTEFFALILAIIIAVSCWQLAISSYTSWITSTSLIKMPLSIPQLILSVGISLFALESLALIIRGISKYQQGNTDWTG